MQSQSSFQPSQEQGQGQQQQPSTSRPSVFPRGAPSFSVTNNVGSGGGIFNMYYPGTYNVTLNPGPGWNPSATAAGRTQQPAIMWHDVTTQKTFPGSPIMPPPKPRSFSSQ